MTVSLILFTSCGQIKELVGFNKDSEGSETIGSKLPTPPTPAAKKTFLDKWGTTICVGGVSTTVLVCADLGMKRCGCFKAKTKAPQHQPGPRTQHRQLKTTDPHKKAILLEEQRPSS
jgi:hypothetical protein